MIEVDTQDVSIGGGLFGVGRHFCLIQEVKVSTTKKDGTPHKDGPQLNVKMQSQASDPPTDTNKTRMCFLPIQGWKAGSLWRLAIACGLATEEQFKELQKGGKPGAIDEEKLVGKLVCVEVFEAEDANGKWWERESFYSITSPQAAAFPRDQVIIDQYKIPMPARMDNPPPVERKAHKDSKGAAPTGTVAENPLANSNGNGAATSATVTAAAQDYSDLV